MIYNVTYERDKRGWWVATIPAIPGCHTQARTIRQARERIREALSLFTKGAAEVDLVDDIRLPADVKRLLASQKSARAKAEIEQKKAQETLRKTVRRLTALRISVRDAGELLGISHQRVQQLAS